jgi:uncharacterized LabA/DUF88 family protein
VVHRQQYNINPPQAAQQYVTINIMNHAFIDGQNLTKGTTKDPNPWKIDLKKFRTYLKTKYDVKTAYYFIGVYNKKLENLYKFLEHTGYKVVFREHDIKAQGKKKGNVDTDIVLSVMDEVFVKQKPIKVVLVTGDGDYKRMVELLIKKRKFKKILFPNKKWSGLYKTLPDNYFAKIYTSDMRQLLELKK